METGLIATYVPELVVTSFVVAVAASYAALKTTGRIRASDAVARRWWLAGGALAMGIGVWSMHFIGMLALQMDVGSSYSMTETFASLVVVVVAASLAVRYAAHNPESLPRLAVAGTGLGLSVVVMHYMGMFGLKIYGFITWDMALVGASMLIAVVAATAALWLAFNTPTMARRVLAALVMGVAVCAMHYTGMAAAEFVCTTDNRAAIPQGTGFISAFRLPLLVTATTVLMTLLLSMDQLFQHLAARGQRARRATGTQRA